MTPCGLTQLPPLSPSSLYNTLPTTHPAPLSPSTGAPHSPRSSSLALLRPPRRRAGAPSPLQSRAGQPPPRRRQRRSRQGTAPGPAGGGGGGAGEGRKTARPGHLLGAQVGPAEALLPFLPTRPTVVVPQRHFLRGPGRHHAHPIRSSLRRPIPSRLGDLIR